MKKTIIIEVIKLIVSYSTIKMSKNRKVLTILNKVNKLILNKDDFESIFVHTLVEYGVDKSEKDLVKFFDSANIKEAIKERKHINNNQKFIEICKSVFDEFQGLEYFEDFSKLRKEIDEFIQIYEYIILQTTTPFQLMKYNEDKKFQFEILEANYKNSFEFQSEKYLKHLITEFDIEFPDNKYIQQKGELRIKSWKEPFDKKLQGKRHVIEYNRDSKNEYYDEPLNPIDQYINTWINDDNQNFLAIFGEYGTGKTSLCKHIAKELALLYSGKKTKIINDEHNRIVFLLNLRNFKAEDVEKYIIAELNENGIKDFSKPDLYSRIDNKELIFIFDGFDEMTQKIDTEEKKANFLQIEKLIGERKNSKVILTSREEYFTFDEELNEVFKNKENKNYKIIHLNLFDDEQIKEYLETHTANAQFYLEKIEQIYDLSDLAPRPVLLDFIVKYLPKLIEEKGEDITINASDLYKTGIENELEKKSREISFLNNKLPTRKRLLLLQKLSVWMYEKDTLTIDTRIIKEALYLEKFFKVKEEYEIIKYLNMFLSFTFLTKESDFTFRISHKSFRDYLVATELIKEINNEKVNVFGKQQTSSEINHFISEMKPDRNKLEKLIKVADEEEETTEQNKWQKSNAINLILKMDNPKYRGNEDFNDKEIMLDGSKLSDIAILKELKNLKKTKLFLANNQISNLIHLEGLKDLRELSLAKNQISSIEHLRNLNMLVHLNLSENKIINIEPIENMINLTDLVLSEMQLISIKPLKEFNDLIYLELSNNQIYNIKPITKLKKLTELILDKNKIINIESISGLQDLKLLDLSANQIKNIDCLDKLKKLYNLSLSSNQIENLNSLKDLSRLNYLYLFNNRITDLLPLKELKMLERLDLENNLIIDLNPLNKMKNLKILNLEGNQINNLEPLKDLKNLKELYLSNNQITNLEPLRELKNLDTLYLDNNQLSDLEPLKELKKLTWVSLRLNKICDIQSLKRATNIKEIYLFGNSLEDSQIQELEKSLPNAYVIDIDQQEP